MTRSLVDELLEERREEQARENADLTFIPDLDLEWLLGPDVEIVFTPDES